MRYFYALVFLLFIGCGGDSSEGNVNASSLGYGATITDELYQYQWSIHDNDSFFTQYNINTNASIGLDSYIDTYRGDGVRVAIIDDGFNTDAQDLQDAVLYTYDNETQSEGVSEGISSSGSTSHHGTGVASVLGARINGFGMVGVASRTSLILIKYKKEGETDDETIRLFKIAKEQGARVINCSWGTENVPDSVKAYIQELANEGIAIVFASGNGDSNGNAEWIPTNDEANIEEVITVGATNNLNKVTSYSNYGTNLDIVAPGGASSFTKYTGLWRAIISYALSDGGVYYASGTSFAAPIVSGAIALAFQANPNLTLTQINDIIKSTSDHLSGYTYNSSGFNLYTGYGKLNVKKFIKAAEDLR